VELELHADRLGGARNGGVTDLRPATDTPTDLQETLFFEEPERFTDGEREYFGCLMRSSSTARAVPSGR
jgi:hypothetical protein